MSAASCGCGATWTGLRREHCTLCHRTFSSPSIGDAHRVGSFVPDTRRCLSEAEMLAKGWRVGQIVRGPAMTPEQLERRIEARS